VQHCTILQGLCFMSEWPQGVRLLLQHRADACRPAEHGFAAVHFTAATGRCKNLDAIMEWEPGALDIMDDFRQPAWFNGTIQGAARYVQHIWRKYPEKVSIDPHAENAFASGIVTLSILDTGYTGMLKIVLDAGFDVNHKNSFQNMSTMCAAVCRAGQAVCSVRARPATFFEIFSMFPGMTPLLAAAYLGHIAAAELLLERKADVNATNDYGRTALIVAAMRGHVDMTKLLLEAGVPSGIADCWGRTARDWAERNEHPACAELLPRRPRPCLLCASRPSTTKEEVVLAPAESDLAYDPGPTLEEIRRRCK